MIKNNIRGIAFDLEGPVINVEKIHHKAHYLSAKKVGVKLNFKTALKKLPHFIGGPDSAVAEEIFSLSDKTYSPEYIENLKSTFYQQLIKDTKIKPRPGFIKFLKRVRKIGLQTAIGSSTPRDRARFLLRNSGIDKLFSKELILLKEDVRREKPFPDIYQETARRMGIKPTNQIVFDDSPRGIAAGVKARSFSIGLITFNRTEIKKSLKEQGALLVFTDWSKVDIISLLKKLSKK